MRHKARLSGVRILITGHTGFTGSWACLRFSALGAEIHGYALAPDTKPALFDLADVWPSLKSHMLGDLADFDLLLETVRRVQPDLILHLAAQPLVLAGYAAPVRTFMTNTQGTAHVLEAARQIKSVVGVVAVTTDKVYAPDEAALPYAEDARLGGTDPYSASKAGVIGLTKSLGKELATSGVLVNCVAPAVVKTELFSQMTEQHIQYMLSKIPMNRFGEVDEVAEMVSWLASPACTFSTAAVFDLSGGRATY